MSARRYARWTPEEKDLVDRFYPNVPTREISEHLGRSVPSVMSMAFLMGRRKTTNYLRIMGQENIRARWDAPQAPDGDFPPSAA